MLHFVSHECALGTSVLLSFGTDDQMTEWNQAICALQEAGVCAQLSPVAPEHVPTLSSANPALLAASQPKSPRVQGVGVEDAATLAWRRRREEGLTTLERGR